MRRCCGGCSRYFSASCRRLCIGSNTHSNFNALGNSFQRIDRKQPAIVHPKGGGYSKDDGGNPRPVIIECRTNSGDKPKNPTQHRSHHPKGRHKAINKTLYSLRIGKIVDLCQERLQNRNGPVLHESPHLAPSSGHSLELGINFISRRKHSILHNVRRDLTFCGHRTNLTNGNIQIICNGLDHIGGLFKHAVQFFTTKNTGSHGLCKLKGCGFYTRRTRTGNDKLLVQGFSEGDQFIIAGKGISGHQSHLGNRLCRGQIGRSGTLGGSHDLLFKISHTSAIIHNHTQPGLVACHGVR